MNNSLQVRTVDLGVAMTLAEQQHWLFIDSTNSSYIFPEVGNSIGKQCYYVPKNTAQITGMIKDIQYYLG